MISADAGGSENVNGSRIAMVVIGAMPGSTPTSVPISAPRKQNPTLAGVSATAEADGEIGEQVHAVSPLPTAAHRGHTGIGSPSTVTNSSTAKIASTTASTAFSRSRTS